MKKYKNPKEVKDLDSKIISDDNKKLILYHGSCKEIVKPEYGLGKSYNDYGQGFYCTEDKYEADLWASKKRPSITSKYELDLNGLKILELDENNLLQWAAILAKFKDNDDLSMRARYRCELLVKKYYDIDISDYDIIKGYRADDAYFKMLQTFYEDNITLEDLSEVFKLGNLGYQIALVSERAFCNLKFIDSYSVTDPSIISKRMTRENLAYSNFRSIVARSVYKKKGFLSDYLD